MPKFLEEALAKGAAKHGFSGKRKARYIYGAEQNMGVLHGNQMTAKGEAMERKHEADRKKLRKQFKVTSSR